MAALVLSSAAAHAVPPSPPVDVSLDPRRAAEWYDTAARDGSLGAAERLAAAREAAILHGRLGNRPRVAAARAAFLRLDPPAGQRAEIDWMVTAAELAARDERGLDERDERAARIEAIAAVDAYYASHKAERAAATYVVRAAYESARLRRAGNDARADERCRATAAAFDLLRTTGQAVGSPEVDMAAECAYRLLDSEIRADLDHESRRPRYAGMTDQVVAAYRADLKKAQGWDRKLQEVIERHPSKLWSATARARQGSVYDIVRAALHDARPPALRLYTRREETIVLHVGRDETEEARAVLRQERREKWRATRERELAAAAAVMVRRYVEAVLLARAWKVQSPAVEEARRRLVFFTLDLGDDKLRLYTQGVVDPATSRPFAYTDGLFVHSRPGMTLAADAEILATPPPAVP